MLGWTPGPAPILDLNHTGPPDDLVPTFRLQLRPRDSHGAGVGPWRGHRTFYSAQDRSDFITHWSADFEISVPDV